MATAVINSHTSNVIDQNSYSLHDPFTGSEPRQQILNHRYSSYLDSDSLDTDAAASPSQAKRTIHAHLAETERRLQDTHKLGITLLQQQTELTEKLKEVEQQQDDTELPAELKKRLVDLGKEHDDVGKEIARAMIAPRSRVVSAEDKTVPESPAAFASQANGSPSKVSVPSRRHRNQTSGRTGDIQFAADISTSLLAQVRQLQSLLSKRDEALKAVNTENARLEDEAAGFFQRLRALDESEQRYKDETWNLETQKQQLSTAAREADDREKRLNTLLAAALAEKSRALSELDDVKVAHGKLTEDHAAARKAHDSELHSLRRMVDTSDDDRGDLLRQVDELTSQNRELALAVAARSRQQAMPEPNFGEDREDVSKDITTPEHSPPPSPTKATPRHGGLESETLKSSLHHAHKMIQNLKGNIHREKTEKFELKRMLQEARDELEQQRNGGGLNSGSKRQKTRSEVFKKPMQPNMLGRNRQPRTDFEMQDEDWEDNAGDSPSHGGLRPPGAFPMSRNVTDVSDVGDDTEGAFETADERHYTESDAFETGAESLAGDSTDELTETEDTLIGRTGTIRGPSVSKSLRQVGNRSSYLSTASTSAGEDDDLGTPIQAPPSKFRLKNGKSSLSRNARGLVETSPVAEESSPATAINDRSPPAAEQSLFAELGDLDDGSKYNTPGRSSIASATSTPFDRTRRSTTRDFTPSAIVKAMTSDAGTSTEDLPSSPTHHGMLGNAAAAVGLGGLTGYALGEHGQQGTSAPVSPVRKMDSGTQYTPSQSLQASPIRNISSFITPPKTIWDEAQAGTENRRGDIASAPAMQRNALGFSNTLSQDTRPAEPSVNQQLPAARSHSFAFSSIIAQESTPTATKPTRYSESPMNQRSQSSTNGTAAAAGAGAGLLSTAAAALGFSSAKGRGPVIAEDETSQTDDSERTTIGAGKAPLRDVSGNRQAFVGDEQSTALRPTKGNDQGMQTTLTSEQIEQALSKNTEPATPVMTAVNPTTHRPAPQNKDRGQVGEVAPLLGATTPSKRPVSSSSQRGVSFTSHHPPLPTDHRTAIAKASGTNEASSSGPNSTPSQVSNLMGPPIAPASAYRRSRTPTGQGTTAASPSRDGTTPRASHRQRTGAGSQMSRRSSVSSFASELDERFNIRADQPTSSNAHQFEAGPGTDPRMIQAITQTMIGEYLWKYTRKPGRTDMSNTRHRRYFWVHPYTKTLYWSDQDPQTAGRNELKAKSVAIHSVRVVSDDNPMPPGLHRKSLEVITPGRKIKFTAQTAQRHEMWFNALSYLLLRGDDAMNHATGAYTAGGNEITNEDVSEFNAGYPTRPTLTTSSSRMSMSSYNSRTTRGTSQHRASMRQGMPSGYASSVSGRRSQNDNSTASRSSVIRQGSYETNHIGTQAEANRERDRDSTLHGSSSSRLSRMIGGYWTGRNRSDAGLMRGESPSKRGRDTQNGSIYNASIVSDPRHDSAEVLRQDLLKQERESDKLENVRACCDGKHDVSTLAAGGKHSHHHSGASSSRSRHGSIDRISRSVSKRPVGTIAGPSAGTQGQGAVQLN